MEIFNKTYKNGLRLILEKNESSVIATNILFNVGSQNETKEQEGYSHFIEHLMFKSSKNYTTEEIMDKIAFYGADFNAYTSRTVTRYVFKCLKENFEPCFEIYSDMLINPMYNKEEVDKEREVVIEEMKKCADEPVQVLYAKVMDNYFEGSSYAHDELGTEQIISNVTIDQIKEYKENFYKPENCIISIAGNIDFDVLEKIVDKYFASLFNYEAKSYSINFKEYFPKITKKYDIVERDDNQANVCVHIKSVNLSNNLKYVADLYTSILGNSQNSRLYKTIREKLGLVYTIYAFNDMGAEAGEIFIIFGTRPKNVKLAISEIKKIINVLATDGITEEELTRTKNCKKSNIAFNSESNSEVAELNGTFIHYYNKHITTNERIQKYDDVTVKQINEFAKSVANEKNYNIVAVGKNIKLDDLKQF